MKTINVRIMSATVAVALTGIIASVQLAAADSEAVCKGKYTLYALAHDTARQNGLEKCIRTFAAATAFVGLVEERRGNGTFLDNLIFAKRIAPSVAAGCREGALGMMPDPRVVFEIRFCGP